MIAVAGGKGGCGKTTTTACVARALESSGADPIVVDADVDMPDLHLVTGARPDPGLDALADGKPRSAVTQSTLELPGVRLVAAGTAPTTDLTAALSRLRDVPDPVLVDTPAGVSPAVAEPLRRADATILVSTATPESLEDAAKTAAMARTLDAPVIGAVITRSDGGGDPRVLLDCPAFQHIPEADNPLLDADVERAYETVASWVTKRNV